MLADERAEALARNFASQWLHLRNLREWIPDPRHFPNADRSLMNAMERETELFFMSIVREDRDITDLLTADYTFVNGRLAKHYNIPNVVGHRFRRVSLTDENPARPAWTWQHSHRDLVSDKDLSSSAGKVGPGQSARRSAAAAAS